MESDQNSYTNVSAKLKGDLGERFEQYVEETGATKTDVIKKGIKLVLAEAEQLAGDELPLEPPSDSQLAHGYQRLVMASNSNGVIKGSVARRVTTNGPNNLAKTETRDLVLRPLHDRGYLKRVSSVYGDEAWELVGFNGSGGADCPECECPWTEISHIDEDHYLVLRCEECEHEFIDPEEFVIDAREEEAAAEFERLGAQEVVERVE